MNDVHRNYWEAFNRIGSETLKQNGFSFELLPEQAESPTSFRIKLRREGQKYLVSFSSHHLDFQDGVSIEEGGQLVLPTAEQRSVGQGLYGYTDQSIKEMIDNLCQLNN